MALQKPQALLQAEQRQAAQTSAEFNRAVAHVLAHGHIGEWGSDHTQETKSFSGWNYLAIAAIGRQAARAHGYVYSAEPKAASLRKKAKSQFRGMWKSLAQDGAADAVDDGNWVSKQVDQPNASQDGAMFRWEYIQQMHLHGACLIWNRPTRDGTHTAARYIIPMALSQPVFAGQDKANPNGGVRIQTYQAGLGFYLHPMLRALTGATIPIEQLSIIRYPHPVLRGDGRSPTDAAGWWVDVAQMIDRTRWKHLKRGPRPYSFVTFDNKEMTPKELDEIEKRINRKLSDERYEDKAVALGGGAELPNIATPMEMDYTGSFDQIGQSILAIHGVGKAMVGLQDGMTYGSLAAAIQQANTVVQSDLDMLAGEWTALVQQEGEAVVVEFEVQPYDDPQLIETQLGTDLSAGIRTGREWRAIRGLPPFGDWRDDARVTSQGFVVDEPTPPKQQETPPAPPSDTPPGVPPDVSASIPGTEGAGSPPDSFARSLTVSQRRTPTKPAIVVDLDGELVRPGSAISANGIGYPDESMVERLHTLRADGSPVVIFTCREDNEVLRGWLTRHNVPYDGINEFPAGVADIVQVSEAHVDAVLKTDVARTSPLPEREVGCIMLEIPKTEAAKILALQAQIPVECLAGQGAEDWPHITLLYGIVGTSIDEMVSAARCVDVMEVEIGPAGFFHTEGESVIKLEASSPVLHVTHRKLAEALPNEQTYSTYQPHVTLSYVANNGHQYSGLNALRGMIFECEHAVVSFRGQKVRVPLRRRSQPVVPDKAPDQTEQYADATSEAITELGDMFAKCVSQLEQGYAKAKQEVAESTAKAVADSIAAYHKQTEAKPKSRSTMAKARPRDANGRWISKGDVAGVIGNVDAAAKLFERLKPGDKAAEADLISMLQRSGMTKKDSVAAAKQARQTRTSGKQTATAKKTTASKPKRARKEPTPKTKSELAKTHAVYVGKDVQRYSEERNEPLLAKGLGGTAMDDNEPADVIVAATDGKVKHGIELKTMTVGSNRKLTMKRDAMERKAKWERKHKAPMHTVVFDDTEVYNAKGPGKHDDKKRRMFYRRGYGSFRVDSMYEVSSLEELARLLDTKPSKLPQGAK